MIDKWKPILKTTDSGQNWFEISLYNPDSSAYRFYASDLVFTDDQTGFLVGQYEIGQHDTLGAGILGTSDGGENWDLIWKYYNPDLSDPSLHSVCKAGTSAWAVGENGLVVKQTGQSQWQIQSSFTDLPLSKVLFSHDQHGWIAGGYYYGPDQYRFIFLRTTDGGISWKEITDFNYPINDIYFENNEHGWAVGCDTSAHGIIIETLDGGDNWHTQVEGLPASLTALHFRDGYGWAVGDHGLVLRTQNGATWVDNQTGNTYPNKFSLSQNYPNPFNPSTTHQLPSNLLYQNLNLLN